jgi:hypothetical protein
MDSKQIALCLLVILVIIATSYKVGLANNDLEEYSLLDTRRALLKLLLKRGFEIFNYN